MGGAVFVVASLIGYTVAHAATDDPLTASGVLVLLLMVGLGAVGFIDDYMKVFRQTSVGLRSRAKLAGQVIIAIVFAFEVLWHPDGFDLTPADAHLSFLRDFGPAIATVPFVIWVVIIVAGTANAVNLTDGLDGLASGATTPVLAAYVLIGVWQERNDVTVSLTAPFAMINTAPTAPTLGGLARPGRPGLQNGWHRAGQRRPSPVWPSRSSRAMSRCPACRAVSSIMCSTTQRTSGGSSSPGTPCLPRGRADSGVTASTASELAHWSR